MRRRINTRARRRPLTLRLVAMVTFYLAMAMAPMCALVALNYYVEPTRTWGNGLLFYTDGMRQAVIIALYMGWALLSLRTALRVTGCMPKGARPLRNGV